MRTTQSRSTISRLPSPSGRFLVVLGSFVVTLGACVTSEGVDTTTTVSAEPAETSTTSAPVTTTTTANQADPGEVLTDLADTRNSGDVDGVMEFYAEDAVYENHPLDNDGVATGTAEIRALEEQVPAVQGSGDGQEIIDMVVSGNTVTFKTRFFYGADGIASDGIAGCAGGRNHQVTVEDGKITLYVGGSESPILCLD